MEEVCAKVLTKIGKHLNSTMKGLFWTNKGSSLMNVVVDKSTLPMRPEAQDLLPSWLLDVDAGTSGSRLVEEEVALRIVASLRESEYRTA